jgi:predicted nuclease of predicted toxin-antitoxin system
MKTILLDECIPEKFKFSLAPHSCLSVRKAGFAGKQNGELLALAEGKFDVFVTVDKSVRHQQNMEGRQIAVLIIRARGNSLALLRPHAAACLLALESIQLGETIEVGGSVER